MRRGRKQAVPRGPGSPSARRAVPFARRIPERPPREVLDAIERAARRVEELAAEGRELRIAQVDGERVSAEVHDLDGDVLGTLAPSELLDVAEGAPLPER